MLTDTIEEWRSSERLNGHYEVSNLGRVRRAVAGTGTYAGRLLKPKRAGPGYHYISTWSEGRRVPHYVHVLVAEAFLGPKPGPTYQVNHLDGAKTNNRVDNLEWTTPRGNSLHALRTGLWTPSPPPPSRGELNPFARLSERQVRAIRRVSREFTQAEVAEVMGISQQTVSDIRRGKLWKHVD